jgi:hypothetical protein
MNDKICFTALCGDCDLPKPVKKKSKGWDYWFFTDNQDITSLEGWDRIIHLPKTETPKMTAKLVKILSHQYLPITHTYSLWVDASYEIKGNIDYVISSFTTLRAKIYDIKIATGIHPSGRTTIYEEASVIMVYGLEDPEILKAHINRYKEEGFNGKHGNSLYQLGMILRKNCKEITEFNEMWMSEIHKGSSRDQISFPYVASKLNTKIGKFTQLQVNMVLKWHPHKKKMNNIFFIQPYGFNLKIGDRLNYEISLLPEDAWIVITDQDSCFLTDKVGDQVNAIINRYPDTDLFGAYTNRLGLEYQLACSKDEMNLMKLSNIAKERQKDFYSICSDIDKPIAGFFMMFPKKTWEKYPFQPDIIDMEKEYNGKKGVYFDWDFSARILKNKGMVRLCEGIMMLHCYRLNKHIKDVSHLTRVV